MKRIGKGGKMQLIVFSKMLKDMSVGELVELAGEFGMEGYDLAVRPGYPVNPENVGTALVEAARLFGENGLSIPMITADTDLLHPGQAGVEDLLGAMARADVRRLKLGYFKFDPAIQDYWREVDRVRESLEGWEKLGRRYGIRICCHTHSNRCMGLNAGMLMHLIRGFDPGCIGAYLDTGHLRVEGEEFAVAAAMVKDYLSMVAVKDMLLERVEKSGHGAVKRTVVEAGRGMVDWSAVFAELARLGFDGPVSVHCEFDIEAGERLPAIRREVTFFRNMREQVGL
jgi:sugar phosphate isomerase/epimerase